MTSSNIAALGVASTLSQISSTFSDINAAFSRVGTLPTTEYFVRNLFKILKSIDLFGDVTSVNSLWNSSWTLVWDHVIW